MSVASLADSAKLFFSARRMLFWGQSQPGCEMTSRGEIARISDGRRDRGGDIGANRLHRHQPPANLGFLRQRQDPLLENLKPALNVVDLRDDISEGLSSDRRQTFVVSSQAHQFVSFRGPLGGDYPQFGK